MRFFALALLTLWLAACASSQHRAPIEQADWGRKSRPAPQPSPQPMAAAPASSSSASASSGAWESGRKPGTITVKPGSTVYSIAREYNRTPQEIAAWNGGLGNGTQISVGQQLRVMPPGETASATPIRSSHSDVEGEAIPPPPINNEPTATPPVGPPPVPAPVTNEAGQPAANIALLWPVKGGDVIEQFGNGNKGIAISGNAGDVIYAAAPGRVVYAGVLRGYGNLVIIKHNATYLTAYAHNQEILVKEGQQVGRGQRVAKMGKSGTDRVKLHFELRRDGTPIDPVPLLPAR